ncbi:GNAT family N-acetyltransferase [Mariniblastus sp.]|nr:GNAT family N-acetyltransferase [Mariniblastus sp.]
MEHTVRLANENDIGNLLELINLIQPHVPWDEKILRWQFFDGPGGPARVYIVEVEKRIVAQYVAVPYEINISIDEIAVAWMIQDVMTHPDFRGQGILHALGKRCLDEIRDSQAYGFTFPNEKSAGSFRRNGWTRLCSVPFRSVEMESTVAKHGPNKLIEVDSASDLEIPSLPTQFGVKRDVEYLNWRYGKPGQIYRMFHASTGYVILKRYESDGDAILHICDLVVQNDESVSDVLEQVYSVAKQSGAKVVTAWLTDGHPYAESFNASGLSLADELPVSVYVTGPQKADPTLAQAARWHITHGDSDVY